MESQRPNSPGWQCLDGLMWSHSDQSDRLGSTLIWMLTLSSRLSGSFWMFWESFGYGCAGVSQQSAMESGNCQWHLVAVTAFQQAGVYGTMPTLLMLRQTHSWRWRFVYCSFSFFPKTRTRIWLENGLQGCTVLFSELRLLFGRAWT